ncbi:hypothetical protein M951_chr1158 (nucleomorph) [Lotharella oceanica]|uniref:Uncharacterized protein n=1 Tax=Lotharella oceanica TaxID=641309 RepID=A0A060DAA3_9EUKA|nr:hypothetical protein M951_chr1158 [Lotharella oceanica]
MCIFSKCDKFIIQYKILCIFKKIKKKSVQYNLKKFFFIYKFLNIKNIYIKIFLIILFTNLVFSLDTCKNYRFLNKIHVLLFNNLFYNILSYVLSGTLFFYYTIARIQLFNILIFFFDLYNIFFLENYLTKSIKNSILQWSYSNIFNCSYLNFIFMLIYPYFNSVLSKTIKKDFREFFNNCGNYRYIMNIQSVVFQNIIKISFSNRKLFFVSFLYRVYNECIICSDIVIILLNINNVIKKKLLLFLLIINQDPVPLLRLCISNVFLNFKSIVLIINKHYYNYGINYTISKNIMES